MSDIGGRGKNDWAPDVRGRLSPLRLTPTREAEIVDELSQHLDDRYRELIAGGASDTEAARLTLAEFREGNILARYMAPLRQSNAPFAPRAEPGSRHLLSDAWQDVRYAVRTFVRQRGFAVAAVLTVALGVGANSAIFSVVRGVLLEALPFKNADRLYRVRMVYPDGNAYTTLSAPDFMSVRETNRVFDRVEAYTAGAVTMLGGGEPREVRVASVSDGMFDLLGLRVAVGRGFVREEHAPGRNILAVLDYGFWQRTFGGDASAIGRSIALGGSRYVIVGVLAQGARLPADVPGARMPSEADIYLPIEYNDAFQASATAQRSSRYLGVFGSAKEGVTASRIDEDLRRIGRELQAAFAATNDGLTMNAISARDLIVGDVRRPLLTLLGAVGFVLLVACANVASLMLARASARRDEIAVRTALGARRGRLLRQLLTEAVVLGLLGGTLGIALAYAGTAALVAAQPADIPRLEDIRLDRTVVFFTFAITLCASFAFGALPALQATGGLARGLRAGRRGSSPDRHAQRLRAGLIVAEVALAVVLLAGAGLLLRSLVALTQVAPGFASEQALSFRIAIFGRGYDLDTVRARVTEYEAALQRLPGVTAVAATTVLPMSGPGPRLSFSVKDAPPPPANVNPEIGVIGVTPDYLKTIGATLMRGRAFTSRDHAAAPLVAIVNEAAVRRWFPEGQPIGRQVQMGGTREIVGVVADMLQGNPQQEPTPQLFVPYAQRTTRAIWLVVRTAADPRTLVPSIRATISAFDADLAVSEATMLEDLRAGAIARPRFYATLLALFAAVALALAVTGIFGVMSYTVAERTREIGIRMALGAHRADVLRMIVGKAVVLALIGAGLGLAAAVALGRVIQNQLFGVSVLDPPTLSAVILILMTSVAAASLLPAQRAARLDPGSTLRH
jgi:putative ABC transport system permease protein